MPGGTEKIARAHQSVGGQATGTHLKAGVKVSVAPLHVQEVVRKVHVCHTCPERVDHQVVLIHTTENVMPGFSCCSRPVLLGGPLHCG